MRISNGSDHEIGAHKSPGKSESGIKLVSIFHLSQNLQGSFYLFLFLYFFLPFCSYKYSRTHQNPSPSTL